MEYNILNIKSKYSMRYIILWLYLGYEMNKNVK